MNFSILSRLAIISIALSFGAFLASAKAPADIDKAMMDYGLVDIQSIDPTIAVCLKYASTDNFVGKNMYGSLRKAYFRPEIARMIAKAQRLIKAKNPRYSLIIYDGARPISVQRHMYSLVKDSPNKKYVAAPFRGGHHNFGVAVDLSITLDGKPVDMGTDFDSFCEMSHITNEQFFVKKGLMSQNALDNRILLRSIMRKVGFNTYRREWWHFDHYSKQYMRKNLPLLDF